MEEKSTPITRNIDLSATSKTRFSINNDPDRVIFLNLSDMTILTRLADMEPRLKELLQQAQDIIAKIPDEEDVKTVAKFGEALIEIDKQMRGFMDDIFQAPVSQACAPEGTMYDLFNGSFRFEYIIEALLGLYTESITKEYQALKDKSSKYTTKYSKKLPKK